MIALRKVEADFGKRMMALAKAEGHRKALPKITGNAPNERPLNAREIRILASLPAKTVEVSAQFQISTALAKNALHRLTVRGYAVSDRKRPRSTYNITDAGKEWLAITEGDQKC